MSSVQDCRVTSNFIDCVGREIHYREWGDKDAPAIIMWHGFARSAHDFDLIAGYLSDKYRIICPDTPGRGLSSWEEKSEDYNLAVYGVIVLELIKQLEVKTIRWLGTSMGGILGMGLAAGFLQDKITHLIINDVGPMITADATKRIASATKEAVSFKTFREFLDHIKNIYAPFGNLSDDEWVKLARDSVRRTDRGQYTTHFDPRITAHFEDSLDDFDMWDIYDKIEAKTLVIRGQKSDLLEAKVAKQMTKRGPMAEFVEIEDAGHAPYLHNKEQWKIVEKFFNKK
jgi:pimeloyl-ACP methyl ester carboxylesterase